MSMDLTLEGADELIKALGSLDRRIKEAEEQGLIEGANVIYEEIDNNLNNKMVKERSGDLRDTMGISSIKSSSTKGKHIYIGDVGGKTYKGKYKQLLHAKAGTRRNENATGDANYAYFVEFGTSRAPAHPFMRTAYAVKKVVAGQVMTRRIKTAIEERR